MFSADPMTPDFESLSVAFKWLDDALYGVERAADCVKVPLPPDTPVRVAVVDASLAGKLFDIRAAFLDEVPLSPTLCQLVAQNEDLVSEGHVRVVSSAAGDAVGRLEVRNLISVPLVNSDVTSGQSLVQYCLRLSHSANELGPHLQAMFGGTLIRSSA